MKLKIPTLIRNTILAGGMIVVFILMICNLNITRAKHEIHPVSTKLNEEAEIMVGKDKNGDHTENFERYNCTFTSNAAWRDCLAKAVDLASKEREWKQKKLEKIKSPEINIDEMLPQLEDEQNKILMWRKSFETNRDIWCAAKVSFRQGSGIPGATYECQLEIELKAITDLNFLYYDIIMHDSYAKGIPDFELSEIKY